MFVTVPFGVVCLFEGFVCLDIEGAPPIVEMLQELERCDVPICGEPVLQLGVVLFVEGISKVVDDTPEETLTDEP